jgi:hypothetical protein
MNEEKFREAAEAEAGVSISAGLPWYTLVKTCRATGVVGKFTAAHPGYDEQHERLREYLGVTPGELIGRLLETLKGGPQVATVGYLYQYEAK